MKAALLLTLLGANGVAFALITNPARRELQWQIEEVFLVEEGGGQESRIGIK